MKPILSIIAFAIFINCYAQNTNKIRAKDALFNKLILGTWKTGNTSFTYFKNGTYTAWFSKGNTDSGSWHIKGGMFVIKPEPFGIEREYHIISLSSKFFKYQLSNKAIDDSIYVEKKVAIK